MTVRCVVVTKTLCKKKKKKTLQDYDVRQHRALTLNDSFQLFPALTGPPVFLLQKQKNTHKTNHLIICAVIRDKVGLLQR